MDIFKTIDSQIWGAIIGALVVIYSKPFYLYSQKREIIIHKLFNVYVPLKKSFERLIYLKNFNDGIVTLEKQIFDVLEKEYAYCPDDFIVNAYILKTTNIFQNSWKNSLIAIMHIIYYEEMYCQRMLKFNEMYDYSYKDYAKIVRFFKKTINFLKSFINLLLVINIIISFVNPFLKIVPIYTPIYINMFLCSVEVIDFLIEKEAINKKAKKQKEIIVNKLSINNEGII